MKKIVFSIVIGILLSCGEEQSSITDKTISDELAKHKAQDSLETTTKEFIEAYVAAINTPDWKANITEYLEPDSDNFLKQHTAFRASFPNYKSTIKHLIVDGDEAIVWLNNTATYTSTYTFEDIDIQEVFNGIEAKNQNITWHETWFFNVVEGRFGGKWDFLKDNYAVLDGLK
ncbi:hypothetical protein LCGC14_1081020 [marine sediment metagenome]|uniref:SnoaL-like domain-containing protein n=2 Tax=root TaxID=1 RepID=A0A831VRI6_9FLAO|nr:hypothetical protein [Pricia antarctica]